MSESSLPCALELNFGKVSTTNQINERKVLRSACAELQVRGVCRARRAMRGGLVIGAVGALHGARIVCDAMGSAWAGSFLRCTGCDAIRCARAAMHGMRCNALHAGWLQAATCFLAMLKTKGFIEPKGSKRDF